MKKVNIGIVGISGLVGTKILEILAEYNFKINKLILYGSQKSKDKIVVFNNKEYIIKELSIENIDKDLDIVFFSAGNEISQKYCKYFVANKTYVIDNSSTFRMNKNIPLIVLEVNINQLNKNNYLIANPNCTTIQSVVPLKIIDDLFKIIRIDYTSYQAVSGSGYEGISDLDNNTTKTYPYSIKDNLIPLIDEYLDDGFSKEEHKMINETKKILYNNSLEIAATCVRVPIRNTHGVSIRVEVENDIDLALLLENFDNNSSIILRNDTKKNIYPLAQESNNNDEVFVGRIRQDLFNKKIIHFFCVADNLRKGAASNSVQIAKYIVTNYL